MKTMTTYLIGSALCLGLAATAYGAAVKARCKVKEVKGNQVILDCGKKSAQLKVADRVNLQVKEKIEGC
ncbi:MAG: hypothetical protein D3923_00490 [Candidatus Electrothrix sp. AR3]|nr:hypothetical protein [Candidatus Electrothrix sp. AR3]